MPVRKQKSKHNAWGRRAGMTDVSSGIWANPYYAAAADPQLRVDLYRDWIIKNDSERASKARAALPRLSGRDLACTCAPHRPCHADVLLELANPAPAPAGAIK